MEASHLGTDLSEFNELIPDRMNTTFISKLLSVRRATVSKWINEDGLPFVREGKCAMIEKTDLIKFLADRQNE